MANILLKLKKKIKESNSLLFKKINKNRFEFVCKSHDPRMPQPYSINGTDRISFIAMLLSLLPTPYGCQHTACCVHKIHMSRELLNPSLPRKISCPASYRVITLKRYTLKTWSDEILDETLMFLKRRSKSDMHVYTHLRMRVCDHGKTPFLYVNRFENYPSPFKVCIQFNFSPRTTWSITFEKW